MTLPELLAQTVASLETAGVPDEALAVLRIPRFGRTKLVRTGRAWRLGVLLLTRDGRLYSTATVTRAVEPLRGVTNRSAEADARRQLRHVAARSGFPEGEAINVDPVPLDLASPGEPLMLECDVVMIRWNGRDGIRPLADYLADRLALLGEKPRSPARPAADEMTHVAAMPPAIPATCVTSELCGVWRTVSLGERATTCRPG